MFVQNIGVTIKPNTSVVLGKKNIGRKTLFATWLR